MRLKVKNSASITVIYPSYNAYESVSCSKLFIKPLSFSAAKLRWLKFNFSPSNFAAEKESGFMTYFEQETDSYAL